MTHSHRCRGSEHIGRIAAAHGFQDWKTLWDLNPSLQQRRRNPNLLFKGPSLAGDGDTLDVVRLRRREEGRASESHHSFRTRSRKLFLRLRLLNEDFSALRNADYRLLIEGFPHPRTGKTDASGKIEMEIPTACHRAHLIVRLPAPPGGEGLRGETSVRWELRIGALNPILEEAPDARCLSGVQQRLNNLAFSCGPVTGLPGPGTESALRRFQTQFGLAITGDSDRATQAKLQEVHDDPSGVLEPASEPAARPTETRSRTSSPTSPPRPEDIGHVAPDFEAPAHINTLRVRAEYRITLRLGDIEDLFKDAPESDEGKMARMQVLGLFYFPLGHARRLDALSVGWDWFKTEILRHALGRIPSESDAVRALVHGLRSRVLSGAVPPAWAVEGPRSGLPPSEPEDAATAFAKIRIPGGYSYGRELFGTPSVNSDPTYDPAMRFGADLHQVEQLYYRDNPVLGKIPILARVERRRSASEPWVPASDKTVYFQLLRPPSHLPAEGEDLERFARPVLDRGPWIGTAREEGRSPDAIDPQGMNCPQDRGGKRGLDVAGNVFETASRPGFHAPHPGRALPHSPYGVAEPSHRHAVRVKTNDQGEAGVIFMPSKCGGDRYRIRAYIGPPTLPSDGTDEEAVRVDTGTLVVWRNIRISRYLRQEVGTPHEDLLRQVDAEPFQLGDEIGYLDRFSMVGMVNGVPDRVGLPDLQVTRPAPPFSSLVRHFAWAYCEVEFDRPGADLPESLTQEEWTEARNAAVAGAQRGLADLRLSLNLDLLFCRELDGTLRVDNAVSHLPVRSPQDYNARFGDLRVPHRIPLDRGGLPVNLWRMDALLLDYALPEFLRVVSREGRLPGLTLIQGANGHTWQALYRQVSHSGLAKHFRGCFVWRGRDAYPESLSPDQFHLSYDFTSNACHELGHCLYRDHAPGHNPGQGEAGGATPADHDPPETARCVMSYQNSTGQFCSKCLFALRGWDIRGIPS